jgi:integrase/recombinase XerD
MWLDIHSTAFLESLKVRGYATASLLGYKRCLTKFSNFLVKKKIEEICQINVDTIRAYHLFLLEENGTPHSISTRIKAVRKLFSSLEEQQIILKNPFNRILIPEPKKTLPRGILTPKEVEAVLKMPNPSTLIGIRDGALLELFYSTGIRLREMVNVDIFDVDLKSQILRVNQGKGSRDRTVPIGGKACQSLEKYINEVRSIWFRKNPTERSLWLSGTPPYRRLSYVSIEYIVRKYGKRAGLSKRFSSHGFRHACASHLVSNGANIAYVQQLLGHSSLRTTQIYCHVDLKELKEVYQRTHPRSRA